jgi:hypothetical protein
MIAGLIIGLPFAGNGVLAGLLSFCRIGHGIWLAVAPLLALFAGSTAAAPLGILFTGIGLHLFYQQFDFYLIPWLGGGCTLSDPVIVTGHAGGAGYLLAATIAGASWALYLRQPVRR